MPVSLDLVQYENKTLAVLTIFRSRHAPHQIIQTGSFYIRRGSTTDFARRSELASMLQENGLMTFETVAVQKATLEDLDFDRIDSFFKSLNVSVEQPQYILMEAFGFISDKGTGDYAPTIGGLLLFGRNPQIYLPNCYVKITYKDFNDIITGNIPSMLEQSTCKVSRIIKQPDYPIEAFEEALANALIHRDYLDLSRGVTITIKNKTIEIVNPGAVAGGSKVYLHLKECLPERRNAWLYQRLITIDEKRRFLKTGIGLSRIRKAFEKAGPVKFINLGKQNSFKVVLPR